MVGMFEACEKLKNNSIIEQIITNKKDNVRGWADKFCLHLNRK